MTRTVTTITATGLSIGHDPQVLVEGLDLIISPGHTIGLVGPNGSGKTTHPSTPEEV